MPEELKRRLLNHEGVQTLLLSKSLEFVIEQLKEVHSNDDQLANQLNMCYEMWLSGNLPACALHLESIHL